MDETIAVVDASVGETPAERNLTRELDVDTTVYKASEGAFPRRRAACATSTGS